jgi:hypothetical protein
LPVGVASAGSTIAIADTRDDVIVVRNAGNPVARVSALGRAFDTSGSGGDLIIFSADGSELAWVEYVEGAALLRVMNVSTRRIREVPIDLPAVPRVAQLLWQDGYHLVSEDGQRRLVTSQGESIGRDPLRAGGRLVFDGGHEWRLERSGGGLELHGPGGLATSLPIPGAVMDAEAQDGRMAIITTGEGGSGDAPTSKLFFVDLGEKPALARAVAFRRSSEGPYRLRWTPSHLLVLMAEGEVRGYDPGDGALSFSLDLGVPNAGGIATSDGALLIRTAQDVRRLPLPAI